MEEAWALEKKTGVLPQNPVVLTLRRASEYMEGG